MRLAAPAGLKTRHYILVTCLVLLTHGVSAQEKISA